MTTLLVILWIIMMIGLVTVIAIRPRHTVHSRFEQERRDMASVIRRENLLSAVLALRRFMALLFIIGLSSLGAAVWEWWGIVATIATVILALQLHRISVIRSKSNLLYKNHEPKLLRLVEKFPAIGVVLGADHEPPPDQKLESTEQLLHLVESAGHILSHDQQDIIARGIGWHSLAVETVMTARNDIVSVRHSELLGPLVLHDLHESGHSIFPVIKKDIDHIIGVVDIAGLLQVDKMKSSHTAEKAMTSEVVTMTPDAVLPDALELLLTSHQPFLIVVDSDGLTIGLVTTNDVLGALLGKNRGEVVI